jgi:hypothetical protein
MGMNSQVFKKVVEKQFKYKLRTGRMIPSPPGLFAPSSIGVSTQTKG